MSIDVNMFEPLSATSWPVRQMIVNATETYDLSITSTVNLPPIERERIRVKKEGPHGPKAYTINELKDYATQMFNLRLPSNINKPDLVNLVLDAYDKRYPQKTQSGLIVEDD